MKKLILILSAVSLIATFTSCKKEIKGSGHFVSQTRTVGEFEKVQLHGEFNVILVEDPVSRVELYGEDNILPDIETSIFGDRLSIDFKQSNYCYDFSKLTIKVYNPQFTGVDLLGSGRITNLNELSSDVGINLTGSGDIELALNNDAVFSRIRGSGRIYLTGSSKGASHNIFGSGDIDAFDLLSENVTATISGPGNCSVYATDFLTATISGSGIVTYLGNPEVHSTISGSGGVFPK